MFVLQEFSRAVATLLPAQKCLLSSLIATPTSTRMIIQSARTLQGFLSGALTMSFSAATLHVSQPSGGKSSNDCKFSETLIEILWCPLIRCDNIPDCPNGDDETDCKFCNYDEFKCVSDKTCISDKWYCDGFEDCVDGSDESSCDIESEEDEHSILYFDEKDYGQPSSDQDHNDSDGDRIVSTGDGVVPIIINPNSTRSSSTVSVSSTISSSSSSSTSSSTTKIPKRFRSTMRKPTTTTQKPPEETTTMKQKNEIVKASTSHSSPCPEFELRCVDSLCITLDQICDKVSTEAS